MSSIDDRVVNMQFNNAQFQQGIAQTSNSIDALNSKLQLHGATDGLDNVQAAASRFSLSNIESDLENVSSHFNAFGAIGFTILQSLTNTALSAGKNIGAALLDPILQGGEARAEALQKAQFQFRGLGLDINTTMAAAKASVLGTAFSLDQAATAAGQLGASGVTAGNGLEGALRGIAGVAAQTGASYDSISQIFTKVSGNGRLMGEDLLQLSSNGVNAAAVLAKSMGIPEAKVRELVTQGKISFKQFSDSMNSTFGANASKANELFSGALANMHAALARLGADFEGPKLLNLRDIFNALSPLIDNVHTALMPLINDFNNIQNSGAATTVDAITHLLGPGLVASIQNIVQAIEAIGKAIGGGFKEIFPENTAAQLTSISVFLQKVTAAFIPGTKAAEDLKRTFAGLFAIFDIVGQIIGSIISSFAELFGFTLQGSSSIFEFTANIGDFIVKIDQAIKKADGFKDFFRTLAGIIAVPIGILKTFFGIIADGVEDLTHFKTDGLDAFASDVNSRFSGLIKIGQFFSTFWNGVKEVAAAVWSFLAPIFAAIGSAIATAAGKVGEALKGLSFTDVTQGLNTGIFATFLLVVRGFFGNLGGILKGNGLAFASSFKKVFDQLQVNLKALEMSTNAKTLESIAIAVALLAASAVALSLVDSVKLALALGAMKVMLVELFTALETFAKMSSTKGIVETLALALALQVIAGAVLVLSAAVAILGAIPIQNIIQGVLALAAIMGILVLSLKSMAKIGPDILAAAGAIALIAPAIAILATAIAVLGAIPLDNLAKGMGTFILILGSLVGTLKLLSSTGPEILFAAGAIALIAPAIATLAAAIALMGAIPFANLLQGVGAFVVVLAALSVALLVLGGVGPEVLLGAIAISAVSLAMIPLVGAIALLGALPLPNIIQGVVALTAVLLVLVLSVLALGASGPVALIGAAALIVMAAALAILAPPLALLSTIPWDGIGRGITLLSAAILIMAVGGVLLIPASVGFLLLGAAILLIGTGVFLAATGIGLLALGIGALVAVGAAGIALFIAGMEAFIAKLPALGAAIGAAVVAMVVVIGQDAPQLVDAFVKMLLSMLAAVNRVVPQIVKTATTIIISLVNALVILVPKLVSAGLTILTGILHGISTHISAIATTAVTIIANFINGISAGIPRILQAGANLILRFINGLADTIRANRSRVDAAIANIADAITGGLTSGLSRGIGRVVSAARSLVSGIPSAIKSLLHINSPSKVTTELGEFTGDGIVVGLSNRTGDVTDAASGLGQAAITGIKDSISGINDVLGDSLDATPTIRPVLDLSAIQDGAKSISGLLPTPSLSVDTSNNVATSVALQEAANNALLSQTAPTDAKTGTTVNFTQNNNSPKSLTPTEIYRQTQNQLSTLKGDLGVVDQSGNS